MSANNSFLKGVIGSRYNTVGVTENPDEGAQRRRVCPISLQA